MPIKHFDNVYDIILVAHKIRNDFEEPVTNDVSVSQYLKSRIFDIDLLEDLYKRIGTVKLNKTLADDLIDFLNYCAGSNMHDPKYSKIVNDAIACYAKIIPEFEKYLT